MNKLIVKKLIMDKFGSRKLTIPRKVDSTYRLPWGAFTSVFF